MMLNAETMYVLYHGKLYEMFYSIFQEQTGKIYKSNLWGS